MEFSSHAMDRMEDRRFNEIDVRLMLARTHRLDRDLAPGRWVARTRRDRREWEVILEPDPQRSVLVVVTAYSVE